MLTLTRRISGIVTTPGCIIADYLILTLREQRDEAHRQAAVMLLGDHFSECGCGSVLEVDETQQHPHRINCHRRDRLVANGRA